MTVGGLFAGVRIQTNWFESAKGPAPSSGNTWQERRHTRVAPHDPCRLS